MDVRMEGRHKELEAMECCMLRLEGTLHPTLWQTRFTPKDGRTEDGCMHRSKHGSIPHRRMEGMEGTEASMSRWCVPRPCTSSHTLSHNQPTIQTTLENPLHTPTKNNQKPINQVNLCGIHHTEQMNERMNEHSNQPRMGGRMVPHYPSNYATAMQVRARSAEHADADVGPQAVNPGKRAGQQQTCICICVSICDANAAAPPLQFRFYLTISSCQS